MQAPWAFHTCMGGIFGRSRRPIYLCGFPFTSCSWLYCFGFPFLWKTLPCHDFGFVLQFFSFRDASRFTNRSLQCACLEPRGRNPPLCFRCTYRLNASSHTGVLGRSVASAEGQDVAMTSCAGLARETFGKPRLRRSIHTYFVILWPARFWTLRSKPVHTIFKSGSPSQVNFSAMGSKQQGLGGHACL